MHGTALAERLAAALTRADILRYDNILVAVSGGKDSLACLLMLLDLGVPSDRIEAHHHSVDGRDGDFMDWPVTRHYTRRLCAHLGIALYESWREGGFEHEILRVDAPAAPVSFETPENTIRTLGGNSPQRVTRLKFPQTSSAAKGRWCSAALKVDVCNVMLRNSPRFTGARTLMITGERAEESPARRGYAAFAPHDADRRHSPSLGRHIDHWRPIHGWTSPEVWGLIRKHGVAPHPAYDLGVSRVSCRGCIFADSDQLRTLRDLAPASFEKIEGYKRRFGVTIRPGMTIGEAADRGSAYREATPEKMARCLSRRFDETMTPDPWALPCGAHRRSAGPA